MSINLWHIYYYDTVLEHSVEITNKVQPCNRIYYSTVHWQLNMFWAAYRSSSGALTVFAASGLHTHVVTGCSQVWVGYFYWVILRCMDPWIFKKKYILEHLHLSICGPQHYHYRTHSITYHTQLHTQTYNSVQYIYIHLKTHTTITNTTLFLYWKPMRCTISHIYLIKCSICFRHVHCPPSGVC